MMIIKVIRCNYLKCTYNTDGNCNRDEIFVTTGGYCGMLQDIQSSAQPKKKGDNDSE